MAYPPLYSPNPYFDVQNPSYGGSWGTQFPSTVVGSEYLNNVNPRAAYTLHTAPWGGGTDRRSQFVQGEYARIRQAYDAAVAMNPMLRWYEDFLPGAVNPQAMDQAWRRLGPAGRGENWANAGGNARWTRFG